MYSPLVKLTISLTTESPKSKCVDILNNHQMYKVIGKIANKNSKTLILIVQGYLLCFYIEQDQNKMFRICYISKLN